CSLDFVAVASMVAAATVIGRKVAIRPKRHDDWTVVPNLWGMIVGRPGLLKTPALNEAMKPLRRLEAMAREDYAARIKEHQVNLIVGQAQADAAKAKLKKAAAKDFSAENLQRLAEETLAAAAAEEPKERRYILNDTTVEKLGEVLKANPNGVLVFRDELLGFLRSMEKQGHESDRAFYIEAWNGNGSFTYDRIARGTVYIPSAVVSVFGGTQPGPIARCIREGVSGSNDDGLVSRFQLGVFPDEAGEWRNVDHWPDTAAKNLAFEVFQYLDGLDALAIGATADPDDDEAPPFMRF
ncbi:DUF3987 domain-containing protein, partial [Singulisphaera rosea]